MVRTRDPLPEASASAEHTKSAERRPWQFTLRDALALTTAAAGAAALVRWKGAGSLVLSTGILLAWLNCRGRLARAQSPRTRPKFFYAAWLILGASLFLPAAKGCNNSTIYGWQAANACALIEVDLTNRLIRGEAPEDRSAETMAGVGWFGLLNLANLLALLSPLLLWRLQKQQGEWLASTLAVASVGVWAVSLRDPHMLIGCYVWCAGFLIMAVGYPIRLGAFFAMVALAFVFVIV